MKKAAIYARSTPGQDVKAQLFELRQLAEQLGWEIACEYTDIGVSGKARRPGLDSMFRDARKQEFSMVLISSLDRLGKDTKDFLEIICQLNNLSIGLISVQESLDSGEPHGRIFLDSIVTIAGLGKSFRVEAIKAGMRRAKLDGRCYGRAPLKVDHQAIVRDRLAGMSLTQVAKRYSLSRASVVRYVREELQRGGSGAVECAAAGRKRSVALEHVAKGNALRHVV